MNRMICLTLLGFAACTGGADEEPTLLDDIPGLRIVFSASPTAARVYVEYEIEYDGGPQCALLHESFRATIGEATMAVAHPGGVGGIDDWDCDYPRLALEAPPAVDAIVLADDSRQISIDLGGRLARLLPPSPWTVEAGAPVTVRYAPGQDALRYGVMKLALVDAAGQPLAEDIPFTASTDDEISFEAPDRPGSQRLALRSPDIGVPKDWPCGNARCQVVGSGKPPLAAPIEILPPPTL